jgi:hypothetical protein
MVLLLTAVLSSAQESAQVALRGEKLQMQPAYRSAQLPLTFEANHGQISSQVKFLTHGKGYTAYLTVGGMVLSLRPNQPVPAQQTSNGAASNKSQQLSTTLQFKLVGAAQNPTVIGEDLQPGRVNYFIGRDPAKWHTNVPTYAKVLYKNVYPGIDLVYYGNQRQLEYDFAVSPGADPGRIQFEITGANQIGLDAEGNLVLQTIGGELHFQSPLVYQESNGVRVPVGGMYVMDDSTHVGFHVAQYDSSKPLVIDPVLVYSTYLGGSGDDQPTGIAVDGSGCVYVAGYTDSTDFPLATLGSLPAGATHVFVAKLDSTGSNLIYADYVGGNGGDYGNALVLDSANDVYVTGSTTSSDFPVVNPYQGTYPGSYNGFLTRISADGSSLLYSTYLGGNSSDAPSSIAIDSSGSVLVAGNTASTNFPVVNAYQATVSPNQGGLYGYYGFLTKFSSNGSSLIYSTYFGGNLNVVLNCSGNPCWPSPYSAITGIALDSSGNVYAAGNTNTYNFPTTSGAYLSTDSTQQDSVVGFVSKLSTSGSLDYSTYFYESSGAIMGINAIAVDGSGSAYVTGIALSDGTFPITSTSICDPSVYGWECNFAFVTKFDTAGSTLLYSTFLGPNNGASPQAIALDSNNDAYVLASSSSSSFSIVDGLEPYTSGSDLLLVEIDPLATTQLFATDLGGSADEFPDGIAIDSNSNLYIAASTDSTDFPVTLGAFQDVLAGGMDAFLLKIGPNSAPSIALSPASLLFSVQTVGFTSPAQTILLRNMGSSPLSISSITANGDFAETDDCGSSVPTAASCTFSVTFRPTAPGPRNGSIAIQDNAAGSPQLIILVGDGSGPGATLTPMSLTFPGQPVGTSSAAQAATLTNSGNLPLNISGIQVTGDFGQNNSCPAQVSPGSSCMINVTFSPAVSGTRSGSLTVNDNAYGSPQAVNLTGTGSAPAPIASVSPASFVFSAQQVGTSSAAQTATLTNSGSAALNITSILLAGDFAQTNNCPTQLPSGSNCTLRISFSPVVSGARSGTITISDNAQGSPQTVTLTGTGSAPVASLSPTSLVFPPQQVGMSSVAQTETLTNTGNAALSIASVQVTGNYAQTNNCPASLASNSSCAVHITFTPTAAGTRNGTLTVSDNAPSSLQTANLTGSGSDFSLASSPGTNTIQAGSVANYNVTVSPVGGSFPYAVKLTCSGVPAQTSCGLSPNVVTPGVGTATSRLTITATSSVARSAPHRRLRRAPVYAVWIQMQGIGLFGIVLATLKGRARKLRVLALLAVTIVALLFMTSCAGGTGIAPLPQTGTSPGTYTLTVSGASGSLQHSLFVTLTVQ